MGASHREAIWQRRWEGPFQRRLGGPRVSALCEHSVDQDRLAVVDIIDGGEAAQVGSIFELRAAM